MKILNLLTVALTLLTVQPMAADGKNDSLKGKTIVVLGDSYVRNHRCPWSETWHSKAADKLGMFYLNYGRNGSSIAFDRTNDGFGPEMTRRYLEMPENADYVLVIAGHNDADYITKHGRRDEFSAGLEKLCSGLKERYPGAKIGFVTPWHVDRENFAEVISEIKATCGRHDIPVFDPGERVGIDVNNDEFREKYFQNKGVRDTAHLNNAGHNLIVEQGILFIKSL